MDYDLRKAFGKIEDELMSSMMRNLKRHLEEQEKEGFDWPQWQAMQLRSLENYKKDNRRVFDPKFQTINEDIENAIREMAKQGASDQEIRILEALANNKKMRRRHAAGQGVKAADENFFEINQDKLEALVNATTNDMGRAEQAVLRRADDQYRKVIFDAQVYANTGAGTVKKAVDMATKDFLSRGIDSIVYKDGSRHTISDYADMAIRTAERRAYLYGEGQKRQEWGEHLVIAMERGGGCPLCKPWQGKVLIDDVYSGGEPDGVHTLLSTAMSQGFLHPRCKDGLSTYFPGISTKPDPATKADIQKAVRQQAIDNRKNLIERQVQKYDRLAKYSLDPENKAGYAAKRDKWTALEENYHAKADTVDEPLARIHYSSAEIRARNISESKQFQNYFKTAVFKEGQGTKFLFHEITDNWTSKDALYKGEIEDLTEYVVNGNTYKVDGRRVLLDYDRDEKDLAMVISRLSGKKVQMVPRVNYPNGVSTPDYMIDGIGYDLKRITGSGKSTLIDAVKKKKSQATRFIYDIRNNGAYSKEQILSQIGKIFGSERTRFIKEIVVLENGKLIGVYEK